MYKVLNISLGSANRNFSTELSVLDQKFLVSRIGTDGSLEKAKELLKHSDGKVDVLTLGGVNLNYCLGEHRYQVKEGYELLSCVKKTPVVDGEVTKAILDVATLSYVQTQGLLNCRGKTVLFLSVLDRYPLAKAFEEAGARLIIGDALFALGLPIPFRSIKAFTRIGRLTLPLLRLIPLKRLYPLGEKQEQNRPRFVSYFASADIIAGDYHFMHRNMPMKLDGKTIITSTLTEDNIKLLKSRGVRLLVTTSPNFNGRSYGSNVLEGILHCLIAREGKELNLQTVQSMADKIGWEPRIELLYS